MRVLYIHQYFTTRDGTTGTRSYEFAKYLTKQGHSVTVITGDSFLKKIEPIKQSVFTKEYKLAGIRVIAIKNNYSNYMGFIQRIISFLKFMILSSVVALKLKNHDIIYATSTPLTVAIPALLTKKIKKVPYIFEVRDLWPEAPIQIGAIKSRISIRLLKSLEKKTYREARRIVTLSPGMEKGVLDTGISEKKVITIPNCSDLDLFGDISEKPDALLSKYQIHDKFVVVHGGSMGIANGLDYIVNAAIELKKRSVNDVVFMLTGDGKTKPMLEKMCLEYKLNNVIFTGLVPRKDMPKILKVSDITITSFKNIPILATNSPNKFFDSLAAGKPVIVNSNGWTKDIVEKSKIGFYVDPEKPEELADLLINIKHKRAELKKMGENARILAQEKYERSRLAKKVEELLISSLNL